LPLALLLLLLLLLLLRRLRVLELLLRALTPSWGREVLFMSY
jgi:hypothetical protein